MLFLFVREEYIALYEIDNKEDLNMTNNVYLKAWEANESDGTVVLTYEDGDIITIQKEDFDRAFGPIVSAPKSDIIRDYAI